MSSDRCATCEGLGVLPNFFWFGVCPNCKGTGMATPNEKKGSTLNNEQQPTTIRKSTELEYEGRVVVVEIYATFPEREESVARGVLETTFNETFHALEDREERNG